MCRCASRGDRGPLAVTYVWLSKREALDAGRGWWVKKTDEPGGSPVSELTLYSVHCAVSYKSVRSG